MAELSNYLENKLLDHVLRNVSYTSPTTVYVGLYTSDPADDNSGTEVSGGSYARQILSVTTATAGIVTSSADVVFPQATGNWGTISHIGLLDAISSGDVLKIASGDLTAALD